MQTHISQRFCGGFCPKAKLGQNRPASFAVSACRKKCNHGYFGKQYLGQREEVTSDDIRDDGFLDALQEKASDLWAEGVDDYDFVMPEAEENESGL